MCQLLARYLTMVVWSHLVLKQDKSSATSSKYDGRRWLPDEEVYYPSSDSREDRAPLDYGFVALLYNSKMPNRICIGAIISTWWILDHCDNFPGYEYQYFKVGWTGDVAKQHIMKYKIDQSVRHYNYQRLDFTIDNFDTDLMFAAQNALFLHRSTEQMKIIPTIIRTIKLNVKAKVPKRGYAIYMSNGTITKQKVLINDKRQCNDYFKLHFHPDKHLLLDESHLCISSKGISAEDCCTSHAILVSDNILIGIMAWSTACSEEFGVDPWVLSNVGYYASWIQNNSNVK